MVFPSFSKKSARDVPAYRIAPGDTNYFALLFDREGDGTDQVAVVEIFSVGGRTPPNTHRRADELFFVLSGEGKAYCDGKSTTLAKGDALLVRPGSEHVVENTGDRKLYTLTVMCPNEGFAELIRRGEPVALDDEDRAVLGS